MKVRGLAAAVLAAVAVLALSGCGSSSASPSPSAAGGGGSSQTAAPTIAIAAGGSFCQQTIAMEAQVSRLATGIGITTPGATPSVKTYQPLYATIAAAIDALDSQAPSEIASAFHTFRSAFDLANSRLQSATSISQLGVAFAGLSAPQVKAAGDSITAYMKGSCGITPSP